MTKAKRNRPIPKVCINRPLTLANEGFGKTIGHQFGLKNYLKNMSFSFFLSLKAGT